MRTSEMMKAFLKRVPMNGSVQKYLDALAGTGRALGLKLKSVVRRAAGDKWARNGSLLALGVLALSLTLYRSQTAAVLESAPTFPVKRELFQMKITERGTLKALRNLVISSEIGGDRAKIVRIVPEGSYVKVGQVLVEFDKTPFLDDIERYKAEVEHAKAQVIQAEEDLKAERARIEESVKRAQDAIVLAELDLKDLENGSGPLRVERAKHDVEKRRSDYERFEREYNEFKELVKEGYVSQAEVDGIGSKRDESKKAYEFAQAEYDNLVKFSFPISLESAKAKVRGAKESYAKLQETAQYMASSKQAAISQAHINLGSAQLRLDISRSQLRSSRIVSSVEGFVIYIEQYFSGASTKRKVEIGDAVFPTQPFMQIPDVSQMVVDARIREVDVYKVKSGQGALIRVDAYPDLTINGEVALIGTLAEAAGNEAIGGKYFNIQVLTKQSDPRLRPGMTARVEILVDEEKDVITVPVQAIFEKGDRKVSYVSRNGQVEERAVVSDKSNEETAVIRSGLKEGEKVLLLDPTRAAGAFDGPTTAPVPRM